MITTMNSQYHIKFTQIDSQLSICMLGNFACLFIVCSLFYLSFYLNYLIKKSLRNTMTVLNSLDLDEARYFVGPDLVPNWLQM